MQKAHGSKTLTRAWRDTHRQKGQMSIEYVIIIGLVALALAGIAYYASVGRASTVTNDAVSSLINMTTDTQRMYARSSTGYTGIDSTVMIQNGLVPASMVQGTDIHGRFGDVTVAVGADTNHFTMDYAAVPGKNCSDFVQGVESYFTDITVGGNAVKTDSSPLDVAALGTGCSSAAPNVDILFTAGR